MPGNGDGCGRTAHVFSSRLLARATSTTQRTKAHTKAHGGACTHLGLAFDTLFAAQRRLVPLLFFSRRQVPSLRCTRRAPGRVGTGGGLRHVVIHSAAAARGCRGCSAQVSGVIPRGGDRLRLVWHGCHARPCTCKTGISDGDVVSRGLRVQLWGWCGAAPSHELGAPGPRGLERHSLLRQPLVAPQSRRRCCCRATRYQGRAPGQSHAKEERETPRNHREQKREREQEVV